MQLGARVVLKLVRLDPHDERFQRDMFERTVRDTLTGLYHRAYFLSQIGVLAERQSADGIGMAVLMLDLDHFKQVNDRYGHVSGDEVLREVASVIRESTRAEDLVARYGGEEFVIALPVSISDLAIQRAERIRLELAARRSPPAGHVIQLTASVGLAFSPPGRSRNEKAISSQRIKLCTRRRRRAETGSSPQPPFTQAAARKTESSIIVAFSST